MNGNRNPPAGRIDDKKPSLSFGVHSVLECVGTEQSMHTAISIARPGGVLNLNHNPEGFGGPNLRSVIPKIGAPLIGRKTAPQELVAHFRIQPDHERLDELWVCFEHGRP